MCRMRFIEVLINSAKFFLVGNGPHFSVQIFIPNLRRHSLLFLQPTYSTKLVLSITLHIYTSLVYKALSSVIVHDFRIYFSHKYM